MRRVRPVQPKPVVARKKPSLRYDGQYDGFKLGLVFGPIFLLATMAYTAVEVSRIITGSLNRDADYPYALYPGNVYFPPYYSPQNTYNVERQHHYLWPWSHPALLFSIFYLLAGLFGISSGRRGTYSTIYLFFTFCLLSLFILPFIIGYFSTNISRYNQGSFSWFNSAPANRDRSLSIVMLAISVVLVPLFILAIIFSALAFNCCQRKGGVFWTPARAPPYMAAPPAYVTPTPVNMYQ